MADNAVRLNKKHQGKEFNSFFRFIGQVKPYNKFVDKKPVPQPFYVGDGVTSTGKPKRAVVFDLFTAKNNQLKIELNGYEKPNAYITSSKTRQTFPIAWNDRKDKSKYPDDTYHLMTQEWDLAEEVGILLSMEQWLDDGLWVEVKGKYEFDSWVNDGKEYFATKRIITSVLPIENGQEIKNGKDKFNYVCDFGSQDFKEVNYFNMQVGILSTYQDEETKETKVNGVFLGYGKERSTPKDVKLFVTHKQAAEGKTALADAFAGLNRLDFLEVMGVDHNRVEYTQVEDVKEELFDPFADVEETTARTKWAVSGQIRGLEVTSVVQGSYIKGLLTEEEIEKEGVGVQVDNPFDGNPFATSEMSDLPFNV